MMRGKRAALVVAGMVWCVLSLTIPHEAQAGGYSVRGLRGFPTVSNQYTVSADLAAFYNPSDGSTLTSSPLSAVTCNVSAQGRNGRDQASALPDGWVRVYATRSSSSAPACLASVSPPPTGPALQGGDTHWAYLGTFQLASGNFTSWRMFGSWMRPEEFLNILSNGSATTETSVDISSFVPPEALEWEALRSFNITTASSGPYPGVFCYTLFMGYLPGKTHRSAFNCFNGLTPGVGQLSEPNDVRMPNQNQTFWYKWELYQGSNQQFSVDLYGYKVPNGGE